MASARDAWEKHLANYQEGKHGAGGIQIRPGDWQCPKCWPKVNVFASRSACFKCGTPRDGSAQPAVAAAPAIPEPPGVQFGVRGDTILQLRHEQGSKSAKRWRTFKQEFERELWTMFGNCQVDYHLMGENSGEPERIQNVALHIANGADFDILIVGIFVHDLIKAEGWEGYSVVTAFPDYLEEQLKYLAAAIKLKSKGSMVLLGGPADFWKFSPRWNTYCARARNILRKEDIAVVPVETADAVFENMSLSKDGLHFSNVEHEKDYFAKAWVQWLLASSADPTFGKVPTPDDVIFTQPRPRSRSPRRGDPANTGPQSFSAPFVPTPAQVNSMVSRSSGSGSGKSLHEQFAALTGGR